MSDEEYEAYKAKKRKDPKICRGGKPHDFILVLPFHVTYDPNTYKFNPDEYYKIMDEEAERAEEVDRKLAAIGVKKKYSSWRHRETRCYICSVCKKQRYGE